MNMFYSPPPGGDSILALHTINAQHVAARTCRADLIHCLAFSSASEGRAVNVLGAGLRSGAVRLWSAWDLAFVRDIVSPWMASPIVRWVGNWQPFLCKMLFFCKIRN